MESLELATVQIRNDLGPFLSYPLAPNTDRVEFSAAVSSNEFPLNFTIIAANASANAFMFDLFILQFPLTG